MHRRDVGSHTFQPPATVHSSQGSHVYTFSNGTLDPDTSSEEEFDVMELRARGGQRNNTTRKRVGDIVLLEHSITKDDTLNKLALHYGCKVADIKQVNNFISEQDMYALKSIKIPAKVNGILTELHDELNPQRASHTLEASGMELTEEMPVDVAESGDLSRYFQEIDENIEAAALDLSEPLLPGSHSSSHSSKKNDPITGADWGIRWWNAVFIMLLIGIVLPVYYIIFYKLRGHSHTNLTTVLRNWSSEVSSVPAVNCVHGVSSRALHLLSINFFLLLCR
uniref:LysM and putative peptidoglycan-binding domain-containing protein 4 n=1 Tax=Leptobrachium leishanense TaxID=445787 RepID=A0A8C5M7E2_9ANUR